MVTSKGRKLALGVERAIPWRDWGPATWVVVGDVSERVGQNGLLAVV